MKHRVLGGWHRFTWVLPEGTTVSPVRVKAWIKHAFSHWLTSRHTDSLALVPLCNNTRKKESKQLSQGKWFCASQILLQEGDLWTSKEFVCAAGTELLETGTAAMTESFVSPFTQNLISTLTCKTQTLSKKGCSTSTRGKGAVPEHHTIPTLLKTQQLWSVSRSWNDFPDILLHHLSLVNERQLSFCSHSFIPAEHPAAGYGGSAGKSWWVGLNLAPSFRRLFVCMQESRRRWQSWARSTLEGSITPFLLKSVCELSWMFGGAQAAADTTAEQGSNLPPALSYTGYLGMCSVLTAVLGWVLCLLLRQNLVCLFWTISTIHVFLICVLLILFQVSRMWRGENESTKGK